MVIAAEVTRLDLDTVMKVTNTARPTRARRRSAFVLVSGLAMVVGGCGGNSHEEQVRWRLTGQPDGTTVELRAEFGGSSCSEFERWTVEESGRTVEVRAFAKFSDAPDCTSDQVFEPQTVRLSSPLGARRLAGCDPDNAGAACTEVVEP